MLHTHPGMSGGAGVVADSRDPVTGHLLEEAGRTLGQFVADLCNLFNPSAVILGGESAAGRGAGSRRRARLRNSRYAQPATAAALVVKPAELGVDEFRRSPPISEPTGTQTPTRSRPPHTNIHPQLMRTPGAGVTVLRVLPVIPPRALVVAHDLRAVLSSGLPTWERGARGPS